jgi:hypothetical protein
MDNRLWQSFQNHSQLLDSYVMQIARQGLWGCSFRRLYIAVGPVQDHRVPNRQVVYGPATLRAGGGPLTFEETKKKEIIQLMPRSTRTRSLKITNDFFRRIYLYISYPYVCDCNADIRLKNLFRMFRLHA